MNYEIKERQAEIEQLHAEIFGKSQQQKKTPAPHPVPKAKRTSVQDDQRRALHLLCLLQREGRLVDFLTEDLRPYECDGLSAYRIVPLLVVLPGSVEEVQAVLRICHQERVAVVARGAGTGLSGGALPHEDGILLSLARLNRIVAIDPDNAIINSRVAIAYTWLGESQLAYEYFDRANSLGATGITTHLLPYTLLLVQDGRYEEAKDVAIEASELAGVRKTWVEPVFAGFRDPAQREAALRELDRAVSH